MLRATFRLTQRLPVIGPITRIPSYCRKKVRNAFESIRDVSFRGSLLGLVTVTIIWIAIFLYIAFYYAYMPSISHGRPIHVAFQSCQSSEVCSYPTALVKLTRRQQLLMVGQTYKIMIHLEMPESPANRELGMFMVCAKLRNHEKCSERSGCECSKSCRSTMLHYRSPILQALTTLALSPFMIFGSTEEKQTILVELYSEYEDAQNCPVTEIEVQLLSQRVELYSARLSIHAHLTGLRYLMYHWPITSALVGICCNLFFILFIVSLSWWRLSQTDSYKDHQYNFSVAPYKEQKIKYEDDVKEEKIEDAVLISKTPTLPDTPNPTDAPTPVGTPTLKRHSVEEGAAAWEEDYKFIMDVLEDRSKELAATFSDNSSSSGESEGLHLKHQ